MILKSNGTTDKEYESTTLPDDLDFCYCSECGSRVGSYSTAADDPTPHLICDDCTADICNEEDDQ